MYMCLSGERNSNGGWSHLSCSSSRVTLCISPVFLTVQLTSPTTYRAAQGVSRVGPSSSRHVTRVSAFGPIVSREEGDTYVWLHTRFPRYWLDIL